MTHRESSVGTGRARLARWRGLEEPRLARSFLLVPAVKDHRTETTSAATWRFASDFLEILMPLRFSAPAAQQKLKWVSTLLLTALKTPRASRGVVRAPRAHPSATHRLTLMFSSTQAGARDTQSRVAVPSTAADPRSQFGALC